MISESLIWWGLAALLLFWSVGAYNRLVRLRSHASRTFAALGLLLQRYAELVQAASGPAEGAAPSEAWSGLFGAQVQFSACLTAARARPLDGATISALAAADMVLQMAWLRVASEAQDPQGQPLPETLRAQWDEIRSHASHASQAFAQAIQHYNTAITQFPALLLAWLFGFRAARSL